MTWARLDDGFDEHPKVVARSDRAFRAHVRGIVYCARNLTNGFVPEAAAVQLRGRPAVDELVLAGLWEQVDGGYRIHDYLDYHPTRAKVLADREAARVRMNNLRSSRNVRANTEPGSQELRLPRPDPTRSGSALVSQDGSAGGSGGDPDPSGDAEPAPKYASFDRLAWLESVPPEIGTPRIRDLLARCAHHDERWAKMLTEEPELLVRLFRTNPFGLVQALEQANDDPGAVDKPAAWLTALVRHPVSR